VPDDEDADASPAMTFFEHLADLRRALFHMALAFLAGLAVAFPLSPAIFTWLKRPLVEIGKDPAVFLRSFEVTGGLQIAMSTGLWSALVISLPFMLVALGGFVFPGLTRRERRAVAFSLVYAAVLFAAGVAVAYLYMLPASLRVMLWFNDWMGVPVEFFRATDYVRFILLVLASFGVTFELPVGVMLLGHFGIITSAQLRDKRRHAIVFIMILAAVITPTTDPFSLFILALPLTVLYEISIWTTWATERRRRESP
jgi:sec-independent protein translocase protein TatC